MKKSEDLIRTIQRRALKNGILVGNIAWFVQVGVARLFWQVPVSQSADSGNTLLMSVVVGYIDGFMMYYYWKSKIDQ